MNYKVAQSPTTTIFKLIGPCEILSHGQKLSNQPGALSKSKQIKHFDEFFYQFKKYIDLVLLENIVCF